MQRPPYLSYHKGDSTANVRMNCSTKVMSDYFDVLKEVQVKYRTTGNKNQVTVIECVNTICNF